MSKILTKNQAENIYRALKVLELSHVRGSDMRFSKAIVTSDCNGTIRVVGTALVEDERYEDLEVFGKSYGLKA